MISLRSDLLFFYSPVSLPGAAAREGHKVLRVCMSACRQE
jgi:hypothetical protein